MPVPAELAETFRVFRHVVGQVEEAKAALVSAVPRGRAAGIPIAEALISFESGLISSREAMPAWRVGPLEEEWRACDSALEESCRRAEHLRLGAPPEGYEQLYGELGDLLEPLDAFRAALDGFRRLGLHRGYAGGQRVL
jgi:hypothetical protein